MATTNYNLPTISDNMTADVVRDHNALAEAVDDAIEAVEEKVTSHMEQNTEIKHTANEISVVNPDTEETQTLQQFASTVLQSGNNVKADVVAALLALDSTLPISNSSTWVQIEDAIADIETGVGFYETIVSISTTLKLFVDASGNMSNYNFITIDTANLGFIPKKISVTPASPGGFIPPTFWSYDNLFYLSIDYYGNVGSGNVYFRTPYNATVLDIPINASGASGISVKITIYGG